jgi:hypothetical protein
VDQGLEGGEFAGADAGDLAELLEGGEAAVLGAEVEDVLGEDGADAGEGVELGGGGGVEAEGGGRGGGGGVEGSGGRRGDADEDLFAVGEGAGEVEGGGVGAGEGAAGRGEGVGDTGALGEAA